MLLLEEDELLTFLSARRVTLVVTEAAFGFDQNALLEPKVRKVLRVSGWDDITHPAPFVLVLDTSLIELLGYSLLKLRSVGWFE